MISYPKYTPDASCNSGDLVMQAPRSVRWEGVRIGEDRMHPGRWGNYHYPSPVLSYIRPMISTPDNKPASAAGVLPRIRQFSDVDSAPFASVGSRDSCDENDGEMEMDMTQSNEELTAMSCTEMGSPCVCRSEFHKTEVFSLQGL